MITMNSDEMECEVVIAIIDNDSCEPDLEFQILLVDEQTGQPLPGIDTTATVTIIDNDVPGYLAFSEKVYTVNPQDTEAKIVVQRREGVSGKVSCYLKI